VDVAAESLTRPGGKRRGLTHADTSFIGRAEAVGKVVELLESYRLVTVTGPGGVGKTRLAGEVLRQVAGRFADGTGVVELAAGSEPALVAAAVATALEVRQGAGMSVLEALAERLSRQQLLLVLDNCEHVLDEVAQLCAALLVSADDVKILATSREPLGLPEEARYRLAPLTLPGPDTPQAKAEAVTLFTERARQFDPDFAVDGDSALVLARLVRRLDGMPLAIELAAARVEALGLAGLVDRLDDRFALLVSANRVAVARQRSLEATVDWSYQLLGEAERQVFRRLAIFPGRFTLDAAEAVAGADAGSVVLRLVDCSLLVPPATGPDGRSRYLMLETLRGYGRSRLREAGEEEHAAAALAAHALHVAERAAGQMSVRSGERAAVLWLEAEDATVHQGLAWALDHDAAVALRLAVALAPWWVLAGRFIQGAALLRRAVDQAGPGPGSRYTAHVWLGHLARLTLDYELALRHYSTVVVALRDGPPSADLVDGQLGRCAVLRNTGGLQDAAADARAALELARQIGYATGEAEALAELGLICSYADDVDQALGWARQAQRIDRDQMPGWHARKVEHGLPSVMVGCAHLDGALELCEQALAQARAADDLSAQADTLFIMADLACQTGRLADARVHLRETIELAGRASYRLRLIDAVEVAGYLCAASGRYAAAVTLWAARDAQAAAARLTISTQQEIRRREQPWQQATHALDVQQVTAAHERGAAMTLTAAAEFAIMTGAGVPGQSAPRGPGNLSERERELITLVAQGQTDAQIAGKLFISVSTVRTHLDRIRDKSGCRRRADLTRLALQEGII
jgi:predicted ATPase/DNA-binding CsgD family transcriptional regulator